MYISIIYSNSIPFSSVKKKSKKFFSKTDYLQRNYVFTHREYNNTFLIEKKYVSIHAKEDEPTLKFVNSFLKAVFSDKLFGVKQSEVNPVILNSLKYIVF